MYKRQAWDIRDMYPDLSDAQIAETVAVYFNRISTEYPALSLDDVPKTYNEMLPDLTNEDVLKLLKESKKPKSVVPGDMYPESVRRNYQHLLLPLCSIFNSAKNDLSWPALWKIEYQTCIPKKTRPESVDELRNISCTNYFSKVFELYILRKARGKVVLHDNQYGG